MARRYVNPNRPVPDRPSDLVDFIERAAGSQYSIAPGEVFAAYAAQALKRDPGLSEQLRGMVGATSLPQLRARLAAPGSAEAALYRDDAPGAPLNGMFAGVGDFAKAIRDRSPRLGAVTEVQNSYSSEIPDAGGLLVPESVRSDMVLFSLESSVVRPRALVIPSSTGRLSLPRVDDTTHASTVLGGVTFAWVEEGALLVESQASYGRLVLDAKKLLAYGTAPNELLADAPAFETFLRVVLPAGSAWYQDQAFIAGTGVAEPEGFLNAPCRVKVTRATSSHISFADIPAMLARLLPQALNRAAWVCSPSALVDMLSVYENAPAAPTTGAVPPSMWVQRGPDGWTLLGMPLLPTEHAKALGTAGDLSLVDLGLFVIADRSMSVLDVSPHFKFQTDVSAIRYRSRLDGRMWPQSPVTPVDGGSTVSAVVTLN